MKILTTVFPHIVARATILFWKLEEETIQVRKLLFSYFLEAETIPGKNLIQLKILYFCCLQLENIAKMRLRMTSFGFLNNFEQLK